VEPRDGTQSARKHKAIIDAATALFLSKGYQDTSVEEIAARAVVGKQTVYKHFADKQQLFSEIILGNIATAEGFTAAAAGILRGTEHLERDLREVARRYLVAVMQPPVLQLRRLIIAEADRFPERGLLQTDEPALAASHFAWLVLGQPLNQAMFCGYADPFSTSELDHLAGAAVRVFLAAYAAPDPRP